MDWYEETIHPSVRQTLKIERILHQEWTGLQDLIIFTNSTFGRVLALDGVIQTTEADEFIYHEMISHVPIIARQAAKRPVEQVLIVGGGDGGCIREVLRHRSIARCTVVEIDARVIELSRKFLPKHSAGAFEDRRAKIVVGDGARYVRETDDRFDVIIIDSSDPVGPNQALFTDEFYRHCKRCLSPGGVLVTQNGMPFLQPDETVHSCRSFRKLFRDASLYLIAVPTYGGGFMALGWASDDISLRKVPAASINRAFRTQTKPYRYLTPEIFRGAFVLPEFIRRLMVAA